ncbi:MAG: hypothetical protein LIO95_08965 [Clostridiales bacterium]|nr:hypothetical protein [Clostridiales bacterium]
MTIEEIREEPHLSASYAAVDNRIRAGKKRCLPPLKLHWPRLPAMMFWDGFGHQTIVIVFWSCYRIISSIVLWFFYWHRNINGNTG